MICLSSSEVQFGFAFACTKRILRYSRALSIFSRSIVPSCEAAPAGSDLPSQACSRFPSKLDWTEREHCDDRAYSSVAAVSFV